VTADSSPRPRPDTAEHRRLAESADASAPWRRWGPYVAGRQWGTVREDYSADGSAWDSFPFDHAYARAYRWGEDGLGAVCDRFGFVNLGVALWNGQDPILKERLFGLTNGEGNHGEDVKEHWWALDCTPTHSWMQWLYRYPQAEYPYAQLREENARRGRDEREYELADTGVLAENRFFDVLVTYAKAGPEDLCMTVTATNHSCGCATPGAGAATSAGRPSGRSTRARTTRASRRSCCRTRSSASSTSRPRGGPRWCSATTRRTS
jgi:hypothetical protein